MAEKQIANINFFDNVFSFNIKEISAKGFLAQTVSVF